MMVKALIVTPSFGNSFSSRGEEEILFIREELIETIKYSVVALRSRDEKEQRHFVGSARITPPYSDQHAHSIYFVIEESNDVIAKIMGKTVEELSAEILKLEI